MVNIPYTVGAHPLQEVPGRPSFADDPVGFDEHMAKYGRTPVHLPAVTDLLEADGKTTHLVDALKPLLYEYVPTVEQFFDFIDHMLRHVPDSTASNGLEKPYAAKARATLAKLEERLPKVVALVNALDDQLRSRKANRDKSRSAPEGASLH
jgi:hypothetical protein